MRKTYKKSLASLGRKNPKINLPTTTVTQNMAEKIKEGWDNPPKFGLNPTPIWAYNQEKKKNRPNSTTKILCHILCLYQFRYIIVGRFSQVCL